LLWLWELAWWRPTSGEANESPLRCVGHGVCHGQVCMVDVSGMLIERETAHACGELRWSCRHSWAFVCTGVNALLVVRG
jgi:hypothetical protein